RACGELALADKRAARRTRTAREAAADSADRTKRSSGQTAIHRGGRGAPVKGHAATHRGWAWGTPRRRSQGDRGARREDRCAPRYHSTTTPPPSCSTGKSWLHFRPPPVDFYCSRLAIVAAAERARALAMPAGTRAQALQTRL